MQLLRRARASAVLLLLLPLLLGAAAPGSIATQPISRLDTPWWRQRFEAKQAELRRGRVDLLWLGDSITQDWERAGPQSWQNFQPIWKRFYGDRHAINLGFRGDSTCHLLWRLQHGELDGITPKAAILLIGANNFGHVHTDADETFKGIVKILELLHARQPNTSVLLLGVLPSKRSPWIDANTRILNARLSTLTSTYDHWFRYKDVAPALQRDGAIDPTRFLDLKLIPPDPLLHPTAAAQADIAVMIEPVVAAMMGDEVHR